MSGDSQKENWVLDIKVQGMHFKVEIKVLKEVISPGICKTILWQIMILIGLEKEESRKHIYI